MWFVTSLNKFVKSLSWVIHKLPDLSSCFVFVLYVVVLVTLFPKVVYSKTSITWSDAKTINETSLLLSKSDKDWAQDDLIVLKSSQGLIVGLFEIESLRSDKLHLLTWRTDRFPQKSDYFQKFDLSNGDHEIPGTTYLWRYRKMPRSSFSYYKPLYTQGATIGETAETLYKREWFVSAIGTLGYGAFRSVSISSNIPALVIGSPNLRVKGRLYSGTLQTWALGVSYAQARNSSEKLMNIDIMWDSILSENLVAHSILSAAVVSFDEARDIAALKSYGNSSIQTGYEYIFSDWSRMLMGPSYNVEQKAIGGYMGYLRIFESFHCQVSITTNNIREVKLSAREGYLAFIDAYWRW